MSARPYLANLKSPKNKNTHSQSPLYKKKLFKFVNQNFNPQEQSMNIISKNEHPQQPVQAPKVNDFKAEIERRYQKSQGNKEYVFPRRASYESGSDDSIASMKNVAQYDLHAQNFKKEIPKKPRTADYGVLRPHAKFLTQKNIEPHPATKTGNNKYTSLKDDLLEEDVTETHAPIVKISEKEFLEGAFDNRMLSTETPTTTKSSQRYNKPPSINPEPSSASKQIVSEHDNGSFELRKSNPNRNSQKTLPKNATTASSKTINVSLNLNLSQKQLPTVQTVTNSDKKNFMAVNNYGTVNNIINYNIYSTMNPTTGNINAATLNLNPAKSARDLTVNVSVPMKSPTNLMPQTTSHSTLTTAAFPRESYISKASSPTNRTSTALSTAASKQHGSKPSSTSTADKSQQSYKSSVISDAEKEKGNRLPSSGQHSTFNGQKLSNSVSRYADGVLSTSRDISKSQEKKKTSVLYQKTQKDILKKMKLTETTDPSVIQQLTSYPNTTRNNKTPMTPTSAKIASPRIQNLLGSGSSTLKTANIMMSNSLKMLTSVTKNLQSKTPTTRERPESKSGHSNKSQLENNKKDSTNFPNLKKYLDANDAKLSTEKSYDLKKGSMRLDLRCVTKASGLYTDRNSGPLKSDRKDRSEYY